jgi:hypothetical protein
VARVALEHRTTGAGARSACGRRQRPTGGAAPASRIPDPSRAQTRSRSSGYAGGFSAVLQASQSTVPGFVGTTAVGPSGGGSRCRKPSYRPVCHSFQVRPWSRSPTICCLRRDEQEERRDAGEARHGEVDGLPCSNECPGRHRSGAGSNPGRISRPPLNLHGVTLTAQSPRMWPAVLAIRLRRIGPADSLALRV